MIPLFMPPPQNLGDLMKEVKSTFESRWWGQGPKVDLFEQKFGERFGFKLPVMVNSGTAALHLAYRLAGVGPGDEVIIPVLTCTATSHPVLLLGGRIVFADIRKDTMTLDLEDVKYKVTNKTKAVVVVHLGGQVDGLKEIVNWCRRRGLVVIEDAAQALGAKCGLGDFTCFSFQAIKALTTGDGGMLCINQRKRDARSLYKRAKRLRWFAIDREQKIKKNWQAWDRRGITFDQDEPGYKYQPNDIAASIGLAGLKSFDGNQEHRVQIAALYREQLASVDEVLPVGYPGGADWLFMIYVLNGLRDELAEFLKENGVETNIAHVRNDVFKVFGGERLPLSNMNEVEGEYLCLPINSVVSEACVVSICDVIKRFYRGRA